MGKNARGNALVGQSGGPTAVINSSLCGVIQAAIRSPEIDRIWGMSFGIEGFMAGDVVDLGSEAFETIEALRRTPSSALGSSRHKVADDDLPQILSRLREYDVRYLFLIGGNDTMDTIKRVEEYARERGYELCGVGIPKTVDNDLYGTDHTPGFPSAANYVALSVQQGGRLACDMQRVDGYVIHQTVGRDAGWLAAASALARSEPGDAPHLIYVPEARLGRERFLADVETAIREHGWASIVVGEGVLWEDGTPVSASEATDKFSNIEFGAMGGASAALTLHRLLGERTGLRGEFQITESLSMCAIDRASKVDLREAYEVGARAVELATSEGRSGVMVTIERASSNPYAVRYGTLGLSEVARRARTLPPEYLTRGGNDVTEAFLEYLRPLVDPLPAYAVLEKIPARPGA